MNREGIRSTQGRLESLLRSSRLHRAALLIFAAFSFWWLLLADTRLWFGVFPNVPEPVDFSIYYSAARIGLSHGWSHIYDYHYQYQEFVALHGGAGHLDWATYYITPPPMAWLIAPLTLLPHTVAYYLWVALLLAGYFTSGLLSVPGSRLLRIAAVLFGATTFPVMQAIVDGQASCLIAFAMLASWALIRAERPWWGGVVMLPLLLKPQVAYLVPAGLLLSGRLRAPLAAALAALALGAISYFSIGPDGLAAWRALLAEEPRHLPNQTWTPASLVGPGLFAYALEGLFALLALVTAWLSRGRSLELPFSAGLVASLLAAPYHQAADAIVLVAAFWLYMRLEPPPWHWPWLLFGCVAAFSVAAWGPGPLLIFAAGWLGLMLSLALSESGAGSRLAAASG